MDCPSLFSFGEKRRRSTSSGQMLNFTALPEALDENRVLATFRDRRTGSSGSPKIRRQDRNPFAGDTPEGSSNSNSPQDSLPRRESRRSFSTLNHALSELRLVTRRASMSLRRNSILSPRAPNLDSEDRPPTEGPRPRTSYHTMPKLSSNSRAPGWLRRAASTSFRHKRSCSTLNSSTEDDIPYNYTVSSPVPGSGSEPPIVPHDPSSGAAARAAAAAQNEMLGVGRILVSKNDTRLSEPKVTRDSESGIGIDIRDRIDETTESETTIVRKGRAEPPKNPYGYAQRADKILIRRSHCVFTSRARRPRAVLPRLHILDEGRISLSILERRGYKPSCLEAHLPSSI